MEAIVLAGGLGTRLGKLTERQCKPMVPVAGQPFLAFVLDHLARYEVDRAVLSLGHFGEQIEAYFGTRWRGMMLDYVRDPVPLGTGGAIQHSLGQVTTDDVLVVNGDTLFAVPLDEMAASHAEHNADLSMALKPMRDFDRYGAVRTDNGRIVAFEEKRFVSEGMINGGVYLLRRDLFTRDSSAQLQRFSLETDFLPARLGELHACAFLSDAYFIDIGVPEDYARANDELRGPTSFAGTTPAD